VSLPRAGGTADPEAQALMGHNAVLIADDDEFFRLALRAIVTEDLRFAEVIETSSLDEAIRELSGRPNITLALMDLVMPGMESAASLRAIRECFEHLKVVVVSSSNRREDILMALKCGVNGYITKELGPAELVGALQQVLDGRIYIPASITSLPREPIDREAMLRAALPAQGNVSGLTPRQRDVLALLVEGKSNKEIARALNLGAGTVKVHMAALFRALQVTSRAAAADAGSKPILSV
jgi:DNA-binding NarL/FixJ family response regulator